MRRGSGLGSRGARARKRRNARRFRGDGSAARSGAVEILDPDSPETGDGVRDLGPRDPESLMQGDSVVRWIMRTVQGGPAEFPASFPAFSRYRFGNGDEVWLRQGRTVKTRESSSHFQTHTTFNIAARDRGITFVCVTPDVTELQVSQRTARSLVRASQKLNSTLDVDTMLDSLAREAALLTDSEVGWSGLRSGQEMVCRILVHNSHLIPLEGGRLPRAGWPEWVLVNKVPYVSNDARTDNLISPEIRDRYKVRSGITTPILDSSEEVIGFFIVSNKKHRAAYSGSDLENVAALSRIAAVALENALNYQKLQEAEENLRNLSGALLRAQDEERRRVARELHDATSQTLAALAMNLGVVGGSPGLTPQALAAIQDTFGLVETCTKEIRTLSYLLHPPMLEELGLAAALRGYVKGFMARSGIQVGLDIPPKIGDLPYEMALALYRIVQEGLTNVHRHSGSKRAWVRIGWESGEIRLSIEDRGRGMPLRKPGMSPGKSKRLTPGVGIQGMRERVRQLQGRMEILTGKNGTTVTVALPLSSESRAGDGGRDRGELADPARGRS